MEFKPLSDRVIVEREEPETKTAFGIVLPDSAKEKPQTGKVVATGPGRTTEDGKVVPVSVQEGDVVVFAKYGGTELESAGKEYLIIKESDILAVRKVNKKSK